MQIIHPAAPLSPVPADALTVGIAQIAPVFLDRVGTIERIVSAIRLAARQGVKLLAFAEGLVPGYPFWVSLTDGARFDSDTQKAWYAHYLDQAVTIERGDLGSVQAAARAAGMAVYLGVIERAPDRGGHSLYCSLVFIGADGEVHSVHRKLQPTYEERLVWAQGDGHGLRTHAVGPFTAGGLNCWENWLPLARAALYGQGENLHVTVWPGSPRSTLPNTPFLALEGRSFVLAASSVLRADAIRLPLPGAELLASDGPYLCHGGSGIAMPDGQWLIAPVADTEALLVATLDHAMVRRERQNLDVAGHYSRPDVLNLHVDRRRQSTVTLADGPGPRG